MAVISNEEKKLMNTEMSPGKIFKVCVRTENSLGTPFRGDVLTILLKELVVMMEK